jgi:hypothetical protein
MRVALTRMSHSRMQLMHHAAALCLHAVRGAAGGPHAFGIVMDVALPALQVEGLMMAIAAIVPHYLLGLAAGAGLLGVFMPVAGVHPRSRQGPLPVWPVTVPASRWSCT